MAPKIQFRFNARKAVDAAAFLLKLNDGRMSHMRLLKLMYVADRTSLDRFGRPIVGDRYVSMKHGPVLSHVYNLIKEEERATAWDVLFERDTPTTIRLLGEPDLGSLSDADIGILEEITRLYRGWSQFKLRDMTHEEFSEWQNPGNSSRDLPVERVLEIGLGKTPEQIEQIRRNIQAAKHFEKIFGAA